MTSRNDFEGLFMRHGVSRRELSAMTEEKYQQMLAQYLNDPEQHTEEEFDSRYRYISATLLDDTAKQEYEYQAGIDEEEALRIAMMNSLEDQVPSTSEMQDIVREQDEAYIKACNDHSLSEMHTKSDLHFQENATLIEQADRETKEAEVFGAFYRLPSEPLTGVTIAARIGNERLMRKFAPHEPASNIYTWIAGENNLSDDNEKLFFDNFEVRIPGGGILDPCKSIQEEGLNGRIMVQINML